MAPLQIALYIPGLPFGPDTLKTRSLGGSETAGLSMAKALRDRGHRIYLFCQSEQYGALDGMQWAPLQDFPGFASFIQHDVCVIQRIPAMFRNRIQSKMNVAWQHDMMLGRHAGDLYASLWNIDKVALLSDYMVQQYRGAVGDILKDAIVWQTRNGVDLDLFPTEAIARNPKLLVFSARPERGLDYLLERIFPRLLSMDPELKLALSAYDNPAHELAPFYAAIGQRIAQFGDRVIVNGALSKPDLYRLYKSARCYVYPTPSPSSPRFREVSCISAIECMAASLPFVGSHQGALPETLAPGAGSLVPGVPGDTGYDEAFCEAVMQYVQDDARWMAASLVGQQAAQRCQWKNVAEEWEQSFRDYIGERHTASLPMLGRHLSAHGDAAVAQCFATNNMNPGSVVANAPPDLVPVDAIPAQAAVPLGWLRECQARSVLDFGQLLPAKEHLPDVDLYTRPRDGAEYDAAVLINRLEYLAEPWKALEQLQVKDGGWVILAVPYGPHRTEGRLWNLDWNDLMAMCGHLEKFELFSQLAGTVEATAEPYGWMFARYRVSDSLPQPIDVERKLGAIVTPRESLSVTIIAGGPNVEKTLHWCLDSVAGVADEIVIGNAGMSPEAMRIAAQYPVRIVECPNPLEAGFDAARNAVLDHATMDWVLWLDTDEALVGGEFMTKYLRPNAYDGFSVRQHHFGIDIQYQPDLPVRLFRRSPETRFFGRIHEHPEKGLNNGPGTVVILSDVHIMHIGYSSEKVRQKRFWRNRPLVEKDEKDYPDRLLQKHFIMRDYIILANHALSTNGGMVTPEVREWCEQTIALWRKHFKGGCPLVGVDSLQYYTRACQILNIGVDVSFNIAAARDGIGSPMDPGAMRFASEDDMMAELKWRTEQTVKPLMREEF